EPESLRDEAIRHLTGDTEELVIEAKERERQAFDDDIGECADEASEDAYERVPIEEFGLAMLRGMGWTEGSSIGRYKNQIDPDSVASSPRPGLLGLGAKPRPDDTLQPHKKKAGR
ncbi:DNA primase large subunit Spp2, partial [Linderina pennispora]